MLNRMEMVRITPKMPDQLWSISTRYSGRTGWNLSCQGGWESRLHMLLAGAS